MAHALVADDGGTMGKLLRMVLEEDGHRVTTVRDGWEMLACLRASLHPMVAIYYHHLMRQPLHDSRMPQPAQDYVWQACVRHLDDLRAHRCLEMNPSDEMPEPEQQPLYEQLGIVRLRMPFELDELVALFSEQASQCA
jgi:CheY-like chemotaxis protein